MKKIFTLVIAVIMAATSLSSFAATTIPASAEVKNYIFFGNMYTTFWGSTFAYEENMLLTKVAFDGNDVYWVDPTQGGYTSYIKGVKDGNVITFNFPQQVDLSLQYNCMTKVAEGDVALYNVSANNTLTFTLQEDGHIVMNEGDDEGTTILGITNASGSWRQLGVYGVDLTPFNDKLVEVPASAKVDEMVLNYLGGSRKVKVGVDGDTYYIQGLNAALPDVWAKGVLADGKISFASGQYMSEDPATGWITFLYGSVIEETYSDDLGSYNINVLQDAFVLSLNAETGAMTADNNLQICPGAKYKDLPSFAPVKDITIVPQAEITDFTPAVPKITDVVMYPNYPGQGWDYVDVSLSDVNTEGQQLDQSKLYYRVLLDGKPYILDPEEFDGVDEEMEWIPFDFECYDLEKIGGTGRSVSLYAVDYTVVSVQEKYVDSDKEYLSEIASWDVNLGGVNSIVADDADVVDTYYTSLTGQRVSKPVKGLYIKTSVLSDGTKVNSKILIK